MSYQLATVGLFALRNHVAEEAQQIGEMTVESKEDVLLQERLKETYRLPVRLNNIRKSMLFLGEAIREGDDMASVKQRTASNTKKVVSRPTNYQSVFVNAADNERIGKEAAKRYNAEWESMLVAKRDFAHWAVEHISPDDDVPDVCLEAWEEAEEFPEADFDELDFGGANTAATQTQTVAATQSISQAAQNSGIAQSPSKSSTLQGVYNRFKKSLRKDQR